jgi:hypothetical protein
MSNGHGDFGWMYGRVGKKDWGKVSEWDVPWESLVLILEIKKSDNALVPPKEYDCPPHISKYMPKYKPGLNPMANTAPIKVQMIQEHDLLHESQLSLLLRQERNEHADSRKWKLKVILASCLYEEANAAAPATQMSARACCQGLFPQYLAFQRRGRIG